MNWNYTWEYIVPGAETENIVVASIKDDERLAHRMKNIW